MAAPGATVARTLVAAAKKVGMMWGAALEAVGALGGCLKNKDKLGWIKGDNIHFWTRRI